MASSFTSTTSVLSPFSPGEIVADLLFSDFAAPVFESCYQEDRKHDPGRVQELHELQSAQQQQQQILHGPSGAQEWSEQQQDRSLAIPLQNAAQGMRHMYGSSHSFSEDSNLTASVASEAGSGSMDASAAGHGGFSEDSNQLMFLGSSFDGSVVVGEGGVGEGRVNRQSTSEESCNGKDEEADVMTDGLSQAGDSTEDENGAKRCPICIDGKQVNHLHYGGRACYSCRGFFRRAVQAKRHYNFKCKHASSAAGNGGAPVTCQIRSKSRKSCKRCRFKRCLRAGMTVQLVMTDEERRNRLRESCRRKAANMFTQAFQLSTSNAPASPTSAAVVSSSSPPALPPLLTMSSSPNFASSSTNYLSLPATPSALASITEGEKKHLADMLANLHAHNNSRTYEFMARDMRHMDSFANLVVHGRPVDKTYMSFMARLNEVATKTFCFNLTEMSQISAFDRMTLIGKNFELIIALQVACFFSTPNMPSYFQETLNFGRRRRDANPAIREVHCRLQALLQGRQFRTREVTQLYPEDPYLEEHRQLHRAILLWLGHGRPVKSDDHLNILISLLLLFDPNSVDFLEHRDKVEKVHGAFVLMLERYLHSLHPDDRSAAADEFRQSMDMRDTVKRLHAVQQARVAEASK